jgi:GntR family histidine utilization transcriptional repressor
MERTGRRIVRNSSASATGKGKPQPVSIEEEYRLPASTANLPLSTRIKRFMLDKIAGGEWQEGHRIPSEGELARLFGTARMTVHVALRDLASEGVLLRSPRTGTSVAPRKPQSTFLEIRNIHDEILERGHQHSVDVLLLTVEPCDLNTATELNIPPGSEVFHSEIVHKENGRPIQIESRYVNPAFARNYIKQDFTRITPHEYLMSQGPLEAAEHIIQAVTPDKKTQELLKMAPGESALLLRRRTWSRGITVTSVRLIHPGQRYSLFGRIMPASVGR